MDRISSCATNSSSKMRTVLSVPSGVVNLSAMTFLSARSFCLGIGISSDTTVKRKRNSYIIVYKKYNLSLMALEITMLFTSMVDKHGKRNKGLTSFPVYFSLGSLSCGGRQVFCVR